MFGGWDCNLEPFIKGHHNHAAESLAKAIAIPGIGQRFAILEPGENPQSNREFNRSWGWVESLDAWAGCDMENDMKMIYKMIWQYMENEFQNFWGTTGLGVANPQVCLEHSSNFGVFIGRSTVEKCDAKFRGILRDGLLRWRVFAKKHYESS